MGIPPVSRLLPRPHSSGLAKLFDFESRLKCPAEVLRLFLAGALNRIASVPIATAAWGITQKFNGRQFVQLFEALEAYVGPIAGDKTFSRRMTAAQHTAWLFDSLERLATCSAENAAQQLFAVRGIGGLSASAPALVTLYQAYQSLSDNDRRTLWLATLLHDIGKATGNRERHPAVGAAKLNNSPAILNMVRRVLSVTHSDPEIEEALTLIRLVVAEHNLVGGLAIIKDLNIFECARALSRIAPDPAGRQKVLAMLALVNFADIDGQSDIGIFTDRKLAAFIDTFTELQRIIESPVEAGENLAWWGEERLAAWIRGDSSTLSTAETKALLARLLPDPDTRAGLYITFGRLSSFDVIYNFGTTIDDPTSAFKFIAWVAEVIKKEGISSVSLEVNFLTDPSIAQSVRDIAAKNGDFGPAFNLTITEIDDVRALKLAKAAGGQR